MRKLLACIIILLITISSFGQNNSGTPYSKEGFGLLPDNYGAFTVWESICRNADNYNINFLNPASYTALILFGFISNRSHRRIRLTSRQTKHIQLIKLPKWRSYDGFSRIQKTIMSLGILQRSNRGFDVLYNNNVQEIIPCVTYNISKERWIE